MRRRSTRSGAANTQPQHLGQAGAGQRVLGAAAQPLLGREHAGGAAPRGQRVGQLVEPPQARDLLDEVDLARDVAAPEGRHRDVEPVGRLGDARTRAGAGSRPPRRAGSRCRAARSVRSSRSRSVCGAGPGPPTSTVPSTSRAPASSVIRIAASAWPSIACSGWSCFSNRPDASERSAEPRRRALDVRAVPGRRLHQHARRRLAHLGALAAHDPGDRRRPVVVADDHHVGVERPLDVVERGHRLAVERAPHHQPAAGHEVVVERVHRLAGREHHEVRDVDDVVDRPHARRGQPRLQPLGRRPDLHVLVQPRGEARAQLGVLDLDAHARHLARA